MNMDRELHDALQRKQAPDDLADRVLARVNSGATQPARAAGGSNPVMRWLAAAAVLAIAAGGADHYYTQQRQAAEAARVKEELRIALQITNDTLAVVQSKLSQPADARGR
jgi:hypothetical protein